MSELFQEEQQGVFSEEEEFLHHLNDDREQEMGQLWIISYSDFMTILMIFFLMLFAHRMWTKSVDWERQKEEQQRAAQESQQGMVERLSRLADVNVQAERINIHLPSGLLFDSARADVKDSARDLLSRIVTDLIRFNGDIIVEGHTDDQAVSPRSPFRSNWELSVARAFGVIAYLTECGVPPERLSARGYGPYRPTVPNDSPNHRSRNRRIEIVLIKAKT